MQTIYLGVSLMRAGSSLLMRICDVSGVPVVRDARRERVNAIAVDGFKLNPGELYEVTNPRAALLTALDGQALKLLWPQLDHLPEPRPNRRYRVAVIHRHLEEVRQAWRSAGIAEMSVDFLRARVEAGLATLQARDDVELTEIEFLDLVFLPQQVISALRANGWPLKTEAAAVVDPLHYNMRLEQPGVPKHPHYPFLVGGL